MRIAVVGLGFMGSTHLQAFEHVADAKVTAVVSSDPVKLGGDLSRIRGNLGIDGRRMDFSGLKKYTAVEKAIADPEIDALDICLPSDLHFPVALAALRAGKNVLLEKPISLDAESAEQLIVEAQGAGRILMVGHVLRFFPEYRELATVIKQGTLGPVRSAFFRRRCAAPGWSGWLNDPEKSGGAILDTLIHDIDYCLQVFGMPRFVSTTGYQDAGRGIDVSESRFGYSNGLQVVITGGWHHPKSYPFSMEFTVVSDDGTVEFSSLGTPLTLFDGAGGLSAITLSTADPFVEELRYFTECVVTGRQPDFCPPSDSALAVKIARLLIQSRANGGETIQCH